jgi:hypothetical protein
MKIARRDDLLKNKKEKNVTCKKDKLKDRKKYYVLWMKKIKNEL